MGQVVRKENIVATSEVCTPPWPEHRKIKSRDSRGASQPSSHKRGDTIIFEKERKRGKRLQLVVNTSSSKSSKILRREDSVGSVVWDDSYFGSDDDDDTDVDERTLVQRLMAETPRCIDRKVLAELACGHRILL